MTVHYALMSHGKMLGHTGALLPVSGLPPATSVWHFVPAGAFELVEPIIAERHGGLFGKHRASGDSSDG